MFAPRAAGTEGRRAQHDVEQRDSDRGNRGSFPATVIEEEPDAQLRIKATQKGDKVVIDAQVSKLAGKVQDPRLRLVLSDGQAADEKALKALGARGLVRPSANALQVVLGPIADQVAAEIRAAAPSAPRTATPVVATAPRADVTATAGGIRDSHALLLALGGPKNVLKVETCSSRLRVSVVSGQDIDEGALKATFYMVDRPVPGLPGSVAAIQGSNVTITIPGIGGTYEGKLDADAITLTGNWTAGGTPMPLTLAHVKDDATWEIRKPSPAPRMMAADADPVFEVASIKPSDPNRPGRRLFSIQGSNVTAVYTTVSDLIVFAYGVHAGQISGAPAWVESDKFDITGKPEGGGQPNPNQFKKMLQKLLADRFQLTFHRDKKQLTVYALTVGKNGPKLTPSEAASPIPNLVPRGPGNLPARNATMEEFAGVMQAHLDRPVVDQTGLKGRLDFQLQWTPDEFTSLGGPGAPPKPPEGTETQPDLFTAIQQQMGLKLESTKAQVDVLVIDKVERPSEN